MKAIGLILLLALICRESWAGQPVPGIQVEKLAWAIWKAEGGAKTRHPYGILDLKRFKGLSAKAVCYNTIKHRLKLWASQGGRIDDSEGFIKFMSKSYAPVGCNTDNGTNKYWAENVDYWYAHA